MVGYLEDVNGRLMDGADNRAPSINSIPHSPADEGLGCSI